MDQDLSIMLRLLVAALLSGLIGYERQLTRKEAGLRTHMLVAIGSALLVSLTDVVAQHALSLLPATPQAGFQVQIAPLVVIQAVVTGIGFLGAGTIFMARTNSHIKGLTTAASIWVTAAIGITVGLSRYIVAIGATVLVLFVLHIMPRVEHTHPRDEQADEATSP
jgi:putative Mg2+ transporter-C (MgtC) family protein